MMQQATFVDWDFGNIWAIDEGVSYPYFLWQDGDGDGIPDHQDAFPNDSSEWADNDGDGVGDNADLDDDNDGLSDTYETSIGTDPFNPDSDGDGLSDSDETAMGTDPCNPDTDGDALLDGTEVEMAEGSGCPGLFNPDSDGDTLPDGAEVTAGTNPCDTDSDQDGIPDNIDPFPLNPEGTETYIETILRDMSYFIQNLDLSPFTGPNENANEGRRGALSNRANAAANEVAEGNAQGATDALLGILDRLDGSEVVKDWMMDSPEKQDLANAVMEMIVLLEYYI